MSQMETNTHSQPKKRKHTEQTKIMIKEINIFKDHKNIEEILEKEEIMHIFTSKTISPKEEVIFHIITGKGALIHFTYNLRNSKVGSFAYHNFLKNFITYSLEALCITQHFPLCFVCDENELFYFDSKNERDLINKFSLDNIIVASTKTYHKPHMMAMNKTFKIILLLHEFSIELFRVQYLENIKNNKIERVTLINYNTPLSLNLKVNNSMKFSNSQDNAFYFLHHIQENTGVDRNQLELIPFLRMPYSGYNTVTSLNSYILKKTQVDSQEALSKYLLELQLGSEVIAYTFSMDLTKLGILCADRRIISVFTLNALGMINNDDRRQMENKEAWSQWRADGQNRTRKEIKEYYMFYNSQFKDNFRQIEYNSNGCLLMAVTEENNVYLFDSSMYMLKIIYNGPRFFPKLGTHQDALNRSGINRFKVYEKETEGILVNYLKFGLLDELSMYDQSTNLALSQFISQKVKEFNQTLIFYTCYCSELFQVKELSESPVSPPQVREKESQAQSKLSSPSVDTNLFFSKEVSTPQEYVTQQLMDLPFLIGGCGGTMFFYQIERKMSFSFTRLQKLRLSTARNMESEEKSIHRQKTVPQKFDTQGRFTSLATLEEEPPETPKANTIVEIPQKEYLTEYLLVSLHVNCGNILEALKICKYIVEGELWLECFLHLGNYLLRNVKILKRSEVVDTLIDILFMCSSNIDFEYFHHTISYYYVKFAMKLISYESFQKAYKIALTIKSPYLFKYLSFYSKHKSKTTISLLAQNQANKLDSGYLTLAQELTRISDFTNKSLTREDIQNLVNDFHTLLNIEDIHELDLDDFNSWEIDLQEYEKGLELELNGNFNEAYEYYKKNNLKSDMNRAEMLEKVLNQSGYKNEEHLNFVDTHQIIHQLNERKQNELEEEQKFGNIQL